MKGGMPLAITEEDVTTYIPNDEKPFKLLSSWAKLIIPMGNDRNPVEVVIEWNCDVELFMTSPCNRV